VHNSLLFSKLNGIVYAYDDVEVSAGPYLKYS